MRRLIFMMIGVLILAACGSEDTGTPQGFRATVPPTEGSAPVYTATPTLTATNTITATPTQTTTPSATWTPSLTATQTDTPSPVPTQPLWTLTPPSPDDAPTGAVGEAGFSATAGWSCDDFPCENDLEGFLQRIRVPDGFVVEPVGRFPGQVHQIAFDDDGRLYATVLEDGTRNGAVYRMDADGVAVRLSETLVSPIGVAVQPGTDVVYVSARVSSTAGGGLWQVLPDGTTTLVVEGLPCCYDLLGGGPRGMVFGPDGYLYLGVAALTDHAEPPNPNIAAVAELDPLEAAVLRVQPHTADVTVFARGIRDPYDIAFDPFGQFYAVDNGVREGAGDRLLAIDDGAHYGWPYWRNRGCSDCPLTNFSIDIQPDFVRFSDFMLPRGLTVYTGTQFPRALWGDLFVSLWNGTDGAQRIVRITPSDVPTDPEDLSEYVPTPFMTGLIRPADVVVAPDGSLVVADYVYGHVWRVRYIGAESQTVDVDDDRPIFATATPRP